MFVCPQCHGGLKKTRKGYICDSCGAFYPIRNGIPDFIPPNNAHFGLLSSDVEQRLVDLAENKGYEAVLEKLKKEEPKVYSRVINPYLATYIWLMQSIARARRCLEIGFGYGALTSQLSKYCKEVYAVDISSTRAQLLKHRLAYEKISNVSIAVADATQLPFPDEHFDAVFMVGVLEWVPLSHEGDPREVQLNALREILRVLVPGGEVLVGIENRFGIQYFAGWRDHNGLRFTSLLPRPLADILSKLLLGTPYRTYTYSYWGYKKLFADAGFNEVKIFMALRSYRFPRFAVSLESDQATKYFFSNMLVPPAKVPKIVRILLARVPRKLLALLAPHFIIRARKGATSYEALHR